MGRIIQVRLFLRFTVCHFIHIHQVLGGDDRGPTAVYIIIHLADHSQTECIRDTLVGNDHLFRICASELEQIGIIGFQFILLQVNDGLGSLFSLLPFSIIQSLTHFYCQYTAFADASAGSRCRINTRQSIFQVFGYLLTNFFFGITGHLGFFS